MTPDGRSHLVTYGVLNLTHRDSHAEPTPLTPGGFYDVALPLYLTGRRLRAGSRLRLAISESLWPLLWPSPAPVTLSLDLAHAALELPVRPEPVAEAPMPISLAPGSPSSGRGDPSVVRQMADDGVARYEEIWPLADSTIGATGTRIERSGANVEASLRAGETRRAAAGASGTPSATPAVTGTARWRRKPSSLPTSRPSTSSRS